MSDLEALRKQLNAPSLTDVSPEIAAYIERLEEALIDGAHVRNTYAKGLADAQSAVHLLKAVFSVLVPVEKGVINRDIQSAAKSVLDGIARWQSEVVK